MKTDVNVTQKVKSKKIAILSATEEKAGSGSQWYGSADTDP
jgi:hypothetical protein